MHALLYGAATALLYQVVGSIATDALGKSDTDGLCQHQPLAQLQVVQHALGIDFQPGNHLQRLLQ
ncbi:hypothetical protein D3C78_1948100 [compost metagenome]